MKNKPKLTIEEAVYNTFARMNLPQDEKEAWMEMIVWKGKDTPEGQLLASSSKTNKK
jgi:hypothetical protein